MAVKYIFVDTDNGVTTPAGTEDGSTGKYHTTSIWPANTARWLTLGGALANATITGLAHDLVVYVQGAANDGSSGITTSGLSATSLEIIGNSGAAAWDDAKYSWVLTGSSQTMFNNDKTTFSVTIRNLQVKHTGTSTTVNNGLQNNSAATMVVDSCFVVMNGSATSGGTSYGVSQANASGTTNVYNTIVVMQNSGASTRYLFRRGAGTLNCYNCVAYSQGTGTGFFGAANTTAINCVSFNAADDFNVSSVTYSASDDTESGTGNLNSRTWVNEFEDHANLDFRLKSGSTLIGAGLDDPASGAFSDDIAGTTRSDWDIGAFEWVPTGLSITSVDTDNAVLAGQSQATFAGTGLASTAKFAVQRGSAIAYVADISLSGSTGGSFTAPTMTAMFSAGVRFGDVAFYAAETSGTAIASISGSITTATNWKYVNVTDLSATGSMGSLFYNNAVSLSDQVAYSSVTTRFKWPVTVSGDGYFTVNSSGSQAGDEFAYRIWDETDSTWGTEGTIEINGGISSAEQVYAAGSLVQVSLESSTLEGATLQ